MALILKIIQFTILALVIAPKLSMAQPIKRSLEQYYQLTLVQSEELRRKVEDVRIAEARYDQAVALLYPKVNLIISQQVRDSGSSGGSDSSFDSNTRVNSKHSFETRFAVLQPIFTGFRNLYLSQAAEEDKAVAEYEKRRFGETLYLRVAELFYQIGLYESDLRLYDETSVVLDERIAELQNFIQLGKSKESEILAARSEHSALDATRERTRGLLNSSKEILAFVSGLKAQDIAVEQNEPMIQPAPLEILIEQGAKRADIIAQERRLDSANLQLKAAERLRWPSIYLEGNLSPYQDPDREQDASLFLRFDLPIYEGGSLKAQAMEQEARVRQTQLSLEELRRGVESDVRVIYGDLNASRAQVEKLKAFLSSTQQNLASQRKDYNLGVVTNLDVLQAIRSVYDAENRLLAAQAQLRLDNARLKVAVGGIS